MLGPLLTPCWIVISSCCFWIVMKPIYVECGHSPTSIFPYLSVLVALFHQSRCFRSKCVSILNPSFNGFAFGLLLLQGWMVIGNFYFAMAQNLFALKVMMIPRNYFQPHQFWCLYSTNQVTSYSPSNSCNFYNLRNLSLCGYQVSFASDWNPHVAMDPTLIILLDHILRL